jgi:hypothetical protein
LGEGQEREGKRELLPPHSATRHVASLSHAGERERKVGISRG